MKRIPLIFQQETRKARRRKKIYPKGRLTWDGMENYIKLCAVSERRNVKKV